MLRVPELEPPLPPGPRDVRIRSLERALFFTLACHLAAMLAMAASPSRGKERRSAMAG